MAQPQPHGFVSALLCLCIQSHFHENTGYICVKKLECSVQSAELNPTDHLCHELE